MALLVVIDADPNQGRALEAALSGLRHRVLITQSATRGIEMAQSGNPDLILLNPENPGMDGIQIIAALKKDPITKEIAVALIQKHTDPKILHRLNQLGVLDSISPALPQEDLRKRVMATLVSAEKQKLQRTLKRANHISVKRRTGRTDIAILSGLKDFAFAEARTVFNSFFLKVIKDDLVVLDLRAIPNIAETEIKLVEQMITVLGGARVHLLAGRHFGLVISETDLATQMPVFFTQEEMEQAIAQKGSPRKGA
ncbi:MAG: response regulator [Spirochaetia bacterium]|nr:response regulator [Spirochaetia bacterium]